MDAMKRLYIVKREVRANSIAEAATARGRIYEITIADDKYQPEEYINKRIGFRAQDA